MSKYTPGPWEYCEINTDKFDEHFGPHGSHEICVKVGTEVIRLRCFVYPGCDNNEIITWDANAHLMAAAPDMYKALKVMIGPCERYLEEQGPMSEEDMWNPDYISPLTMARKAIAKAEGKEKE